MDGRTVEFRGETYRTAEKYGLAPLMRFGHLARKGADSADMKSLAVMYDVLEQCFDPTSYCSACGSEDEEALAAEKVAEQCCEDRRVVESDFERFMDTATEKRWDHEEILEIVGKVMQALSERSSPGQPSASSDEPSSVRPSFEDASSLRAQRRLEDSGRADLAVAVLNAREYRQTQRAG